MPVLSHGVVTRTFGPAACCCCLLLLLLLLKRVAHPWTLKGGVKPRQGKPSSVIISRIELGPSWVLVLRNTLEITVEERPLALQMCLHGQDDRPETWLKNGSISPQNGPLYGTTAWYMPCLTPICHHLIAQSPWKNNGPHCKRPLDTLAIVLSFQDDRPENNPKTAIFGHYIGRRTG